jgi:hypothetical protein
MIHVLTVMLITKMVDAALYGRSDIGANIGGECLHAVLIIFYSCLYV